MTGVAVRAFLLGDRLVRRVAPRAHPLWSGFWLGVLPQGALHAIDRAVYDLRRRYHGLEHNRAGLFPWEQTAIEAYFPGRRRIVVIGAGAGREVIALWRRGHRPDGFECHPALVAAAANVFAAEGCPCSLREIARDAAPAGAGPYDGAVIGWSAYTLVRGRERRIALLRGMRALLPAGAPLLLSFFTRAGGDVRSRRVGRIARLFRRGAVEPGDDLRPNFVHRFTREEVESELMEGGFATLRWEPQGPGPYDSGWAVAAAQPLAERTG